MITRREFMQTAAAAAAFPLLRFPEREAAADVKVNDIHSQLNATRVAAVERPDSLQALQALVRRARREGRAISIAGGRHAMGGQQFGADTLLADMRGMGRVLQLDAEHGQVELEAGIEWPELIESILRAQAGRANAWGIIQKQTGADRLTIGGALAANVHGRGLRFPPFVADVESFVLVGADGEPRVCSRSENSELFRLAIGGYGLFGLIASVKLRLMPRKKIERVVEVMEIKDLMPAFEKRIAAGYLFGDFQYAIDPASDDFLRQGAFSCYRPVDDATPVAEKQKELAPAEWDKLYHLAHTDRTRAFELYSSYYLSTSGQVYWSDTHQLSVYLDDYHRALDQKLASRVKATEMITEIYVPRDALKDFLEAVRKDFRENRVTVIYGTIRLIEKDDETFLAWARKPWACVIFNLHVEHSPAGLQHAAQAFQRLIDLAIARGGCYYLTYHRWATRRQVEACYPQFRDFLRMKKKYDPQERFQSDWYRHSRTMFSARA